LFLVFLCSLFFFVSNKNNCLWYDHCSHLQVHTILHWYLLIIHIWIPWSLKVSYSL
jgi:hypothetical protein